MERERGYGGEGAARGGKRGEATGGGGSRLLHGLHLAHHLLRDLISHLPAPRVSRRGGRGPANGAQRGWQTRDQLSADQRSTLGPEISFRQTRDQLWVHPPGFRVSGGAKGRGERGGAEGGRETERTVSYHPCCGALGG